MKFTINIDNALELIQYKKLYIYISEKKVVINTMLNAKFIPLNLNSLFIETILSLKESFCSDKKPEKIVEVFVGQEKIYHYDIKFSIEHNYQLLILNLNNLEIEKINSFNEQKILNQTLTNPVKKINKIKI
jgi:hypothetical protein